MKQLFHVLLLLTTGSCFAQDTVELQTNAIVEEGKRLYNSEITSWNGTDIFLEAWKDQTKIGGYFSYAEKDRSKCIFYSKGDTPRVIGTILFYTVYDGSKASKTNLDERDFTPEEKELYSIRTNALKIINSDTLFKVYPNTSLNLIPLIGNGEKKVYVLTGPKKDSVVLFGNDYLLSFDSDNKLISKRKLHANLISTDYGRQEEGKEVVGAMHNHLPETGDFITPTDICTLMLYEKQAGWKNYTVLSSKYFSLWNCETNTLVAITREAMEKIIKDQEKRHKKNH